MVQKAQRGNDKQFPVLFDNGRLRVFKNSTDEIFIMDLQSGAEMRFNPYLSGRGGLQFTTNQLVEPVNVNNMIGWRVGPR